MRANLAIEGHASEIYTRAMFGQFGHILYECGAYQVEDAEKNISYLAMHTEAERKEKWCRVSYKVTMMEGGDDFDCECGQFAHMGLLRTHVLKVLFPLKLVVPSTSNANVEGWYQKMNNVVFVKCGYLTLSV